MATNPDSADIGLATVEKWAAEYQLMQPTYAQFAAKLHALFTELLRLRGIDYHTLESRAKSLESFREKIQRAGKTYIDPLAELPDLAGIRVIAYYSDDIVRIRKLLEEEFSLDPQQSADKADELAPDQFGYISVHEVITLTAARKRMTEWTVYKDLHAEVQIRTVLQHAWASISHKLQYKHEADIPRPLRRKLVRLSGLLELADEQFSELRAERTQLEIHISESIDTDNLHLPIDNDSVTVFLQNSDVIERLEREVRSTRGINIHERIEPMGLSQLVTICRELKIESLADLDHVLRTLADRFGSFFGGFGKRQGGSGSIPHYVALVLVGNDGGKRLSLETIPWAPKYTEAAFEVGRTVLAARAKRSKREE